MAKFSESSSSTNITVKVKSSFSEKIDTSLLAYLSNYPIKGLFMPKVKGKHKVEYTAPACVPVLKQFKDQTIDSQYYQKILNSIIDTFESLTQREINLKPIVLNLEHVYVDVMANVYFICLPIEPEMPSISLKNFFQLLTQHVVSSNPQLEFAKNFLKLLNIKDCNTLNDIKKIIAQCSLSNVSSNNTYDTDNEATTVLNDGLDFNNQNELYEATTVLSSNDSNLFNVNNEATTVLNDYQDYTDHQYDNEATTVLNNQFVVETDNEATTVLNNSFNNDYDQDATTVLTSPYIFNDPNKPNIVYPKLLQLKTNIEQEVNKPVYRIGKEKTYVDFFISNNNAVSRSHADIIRRDDQYYIKDLNSKNYTYINGVRCMPEEEVLLNDGDIIALGNEEFKFSR